jgi:hypothetical protein
MHVQSWTCVRFSVRFRACHKTQTHPIPVPSRVPALRQPILGITPGLCFLGHPTPSRLTAWSPAPALPERALDGFSRSMCPFCVALGRYCTPCPTHRVDTIYCATKRPNGDKFPFGPAVCLSRQLAVRQVRDHDASTIPSLSLSIATCLGRHHFRLVVYPLFPLALSRLMTSLPQ